MDDKTHLTRLCAAMRAAFPTEERFVELTAFMTQDVADHLALVWGDAENHLIGSVTPLEPVPERGEKVLLRTGKHAWVVNRPAGEPTDDDWRDAVRARCLHVVALPKGANWLRENRA